jgi:hypothetical protein
MQRRQGILLFYLCAAIGALTVLAAALPQLSFRPGRSFTLNGDQSPDPLGGAPGASTADLGYWRFLITAIVLVVLGYFVLALIFSSKLRWQLLRRVTQVLLVVLLFYLIANRLIGTPAILPPAEPAAATPPAQTPPGEPLPPFIAQPAPWLVALVSLALVGLLLAGIWYFWRRSRPLANPMTVLAQAAIDDIESGVDVQSVVLRCYLEMSQVLGQQRGIERARAMTPREFAQYLAASGMRDEHIQQLTRLFEGARYGAQPPRARDERAAVECLTAIVQVYGGA